MILFLFIQPNVVKIKFGCKTKDDIQIIVYNIVTVKTWSTSVLYNGIVTKLLNL